VEFDDPERPVSMQALIETTGAAVFDWDMGARCCGAALVSTRPDDGLKRVAAILKAAKGADLIVTVCPMCQMNLDAWQAKVSHTTGEDLAITVLYLPQLLGLSMGLTAKEVGLNMNLAIKQPFREKIEI
jgi:heterodisulfide reductase subunit B